MGIHRILHQMYEAAFTTYSSTDAEVLTCTKDRQVFSVTTAAAETRTLAQPTKGGLECAVVLDVYVGALTLTVTGGWNQASTTTITFGTAGDWVKFISVEVGTSYYWRVLAEEGTGATETVTELSATNVNATNVTATSTVKGATVNATTTLNTALVTATNVNATNATLTSTLSTVEALATNVNATNVTASSTVKGATVNATTTLNTALVTATNVNATNATLTSTLNCAEAKATNVNATNATLTSTLNCVEAKATNVNATNANVTLCAATNVNATNVTASSTVNAVECKATNANVTNVTATSTVAGAALNVNNAIIGLTSAANIGFFGHAVATQPTGIANTGAVTNSNNVGDLPATVNSIIAALEALGIIATV